jgi:hypothetical protein
MPDFTAEHPETTTMVRLSDQLTTALRAVIASSPLHGLGPMELARELGVDKTLTSRLMAALRANDPLQALSLLPGTAPLRQFVRAARKHGAAAGAVLAAEAELRAFDQELQRTFGTRTRLDTFLADALPGARRRHQESARQAVYRGMAVVKGVSIDQEHITWLVYPSADGERVDMTVLAAYIGIRRLRPTARVRLGSSHATTGEQPPAKLLREFCRPADLCISTERDGKYTWYEIARGPVTRDAAADVFLSERLSTSMAVDLGKDAPVRTFGDVVVHACKRLVLTLLVHEGVWRGCDFGAAVYETALRGLVHLSTLEGREGDLIDLGLSVKRGERAADVLEDGAAWGQREMLRGLCGPLGLELDAFRGFGLEVRYPLYSSEVLLVRRGA